MQLQEQVITLEKSTKVNWKDIQYRIDSNWCYICTSHFLLRWYPRITVWCKNMQMSRYIWNKAYWTIGKWILVRHKCDNPMCINIEHMELWTHQQNMKDRSMRFTWVRWEKAYKSRLNESQVREILSSNLSITELSKIYNVNRSSISRIKKWKSWRHLLENNLLPITNKDE